MRRTLALAMLLPLAAGCGFTGGLFGDSVAPVTAELEVFNRTRVDIYLVAADGERLDVPACDRAADQSFRVDRVEVRTELGYVKAFGVGDPGSAGVPLVMVETERSDEGFPEAVPPPNPLPPCVGEPDVQVGV